VRVAVLTTDTPHHAYYVWQLAEQDVLAGVVLETRRHDPGFPTHHPFEDERDSYERDVLLAGMPAAIEGFAPTHVADSVNDAEAREALAATTPDLVVSFGTGLIGRELIDAVPGRLLNLHGGDPEEYRGLDTHLWAVYHRDFGGLVTTLHEVAAEFDTGALVGQAAVPVEPGSELHQLRAANTRACVDLTLAAAQAYEALGRIPARPQRRRGRYYSAMPAVLKEVCVPRYAKYAAGL
jgi:hypothetical protein